MRHKKNREFQEKTKKFQNQKVPNLKYGEKISTLRTFRVRHRGVKIAVELRKIVPRVRSGNLKPSPHVR